MENTDKTITDNIISTLEQNTRGVQIGIYTIAGIGLAYAIHFVRPVSKFSRAYDIPKHFLKHKEPLKGRIVGYENTTTSTRLLFDHAPLIKIPLWHSNKAPMKVQVWGVKPTGANTFSWLQCIAVGSKATVIPIKSENEILSSQITLHLPITMIVNKNAEEMKKKKRNVKTEYVDLGERLVELGLGQVMSNVDKYSSEDIWWTPWIVSSNYSTVLQRAQYKAIAHRSGHWQEAIPPSRLKPMYDLIKSIKFSKSKPKSNLTPIT